MIASLSALIYGDTKIGKTTLLATAPRPVLFDADGKAQFLPRSEFLTAVLGHPARLMWWDPLRYAPPRWDDSFDVCVIRATSFQEVSAGYQHLSQSPHDFLSVGLDSVSEIQRRCKESHFGRSTLRIQDWGDLLADLSFTVRDFRDLRDHPRHPLPITLLSCEARNVENKAQPYVQGQIGFSMPYWLDMVGYLMVDTALDAQGQPTRTVRRLQLAPSPRWIAGDNIGGLGSYVDDPNLTQLYLNVYPHLAAQRGNGSEPDQ